MPIANISVSNTSFTAQEFVLSSNTVINKVNEIESNYVNTSVLTSNVATLNAAINLRLPAANFNAANVLSLIKTVDGSGSGLDAEYLNGQLASNYALASSLGSYALASSLTAYLTKGQNLNDLGDKKTGFDNIKQIANTTYTGTVALATQAEVDAGTNTSKAVTPSSLSGLVTNKQSVSDKNQANGYAGLTAANLIFESALPKTETVVGATITGGTLNIDLSQGSVFAVTLNQNISVVTFSNFNSVGASRSWVIAFTIQGPYSIAWPGICKWPSGIIPAHSNITNDVNTFIFYTLNNGLIVNSFFSGATR